MRPPGRLTSFRGIVQLQRLTSRLRPSISRRLVLIAATTLLVIATIPITLIYLGPSDKTGLRGIRSAGLAASPTQSNDDVQRPRLTAEVKAAGDDVAAGIESAESSCDAQISQLAAISTISGTETQIAIQDGKASVHLVATAFLSEIQVDETDFGRLEIVSTETEQVFLSAIAMVRVTALGDGTTGDEMGTVCQSVLAEVRVKVKPVVNQASGD